MPERVRRHRALVDAAEPDPVEHVVDAPGPRRRGPPPGPMASNSARLARPGEVGVRRGRLDQRPDLRAARRGAGAGIGRPSTSTVPEVASTRPSSIRTVVVLPEPLAPRKP